jgi:hypothetical protein
VHTPVWWRYDLDYRANRTAWQRWASTAEFQPRRDRIGRKILPWPASRRGPQEFFAVSREHTASMASASGITRGHAETADQDINVYDMAW